jgi:cell division protein FtsQ
MKDKIKKGILITVWVLLIGAVGLLLFFIDRHKKNQACREIRLNIENAAENHFIDSAAVMECIESYPVVNAKMADIDAGRIESLLENNPFIRKAEVYKDLDGTINIRVWQKNALLRVVPATGESYYMDEDNLKMPLSNNYTARVLVCSGNISEQYTKCDTASTLALKTCTSIAHFVHNSDFWRSMTEQIFVSADNVITLIPKLGDAKIIFGDSLDIEDKFNRLYTFYRQAMPKAGWDKYKSIDVSFRNQVVAHKEEK